MVEIYTVYKGHQIILNSFIKYIFVEKNAALYNIDSEVGVWVVFLTGKMNRQIFLQKIG
jgi:hypothetical protein